MSLLDIGPHVVVSALDTGPVGVYLLTDIGPPVDVSALNIERLWVCIPFSRAAASVSTFPLSVEAALCFVLGSFTSVCLSLFCRGYCPHCLYGFCDIITVSCYGEFWLVSVRVFCDRDIVLFLPLSQVRGLVSYD